VLKQSSPARTFRHWSGTMATLADIVLRVPEYAQLVLRVGWAPDGATTLPETPRRPLRYVLLV
jgi:hypothetical protein